MNKANNNKGQKKYSQTTNAPSTSSGAIDENSQQNTFQDYLLLCMVIAGLQLVLVLTSRQIHVQLPATGWINEGFRWLTYVSHMTAAGVLLVTFIDWVLKRLKWAYRAVMFYCCVQTVMVAYSAFALACTLFYYTKGNAGYVLMRDGTLLWLANWLLFALWYWVLDLDNPMLRTPRHLMRRKRENAAFALNTTQKQATSTSTATSQGNKFSSKNFTFPAQNYKPDEWRPNMFDYLYMAFTFSTEMGPSDSAALSRPAKLLLMIQICITLVCVALVISRAVGFSING